MKTGRWKFAAVLLVVNLAMTACRPSQSTEDRADTLNAGEPSATRVINDDLGRSVAMPVDVKRVVSTAPSVTEMIFAAGAGDRLVGVTTFCDYPEEAKTIAKIGDTMNPNMETIIALQPDIVFVSTASQIEAFMTTLDANGIAVYVLNTESLDDVSKDLRKLGELLQTTAKSDSAATTLDKRRYAIHKELGTCPANEECNYPAKYLIP